MGGMGELDAALLINLIGFSVGIALYLLLAAMVMRHARGRVLTSTERLLTATGVLGVIWNAGELLAFSQSDAGNEAIDPLITALTFSALGFLPSVVVHSAETSTGGNRWLKYAAYSLSIFAAASHFAAAFSGAEVPSDLTLQAQTIGSLLLAIALLAFNLRQTLENKALWTAALLIFAVSALHLSGEREGRSWAIELVTHQSSLPLALVILYQNYRFAFADLFLKRAVSLLLLSGLAFGLYAGVGERLASLDGAAINGQGRDAAIFVGLWIATALLYPLIHRASELLVDKVLLKRVDYVKFRSEIELSLDRCESEESVLRLIQVRLAEVLTAKSSIVVSGPEAAARAGSVPVTYTSDEATVRVPTAESPYRGIRIGGFEGGRRLLSDEVQMLADVASIGARRIDAIRVSIERFEREFREQEFAKLATEAQLTALRSQINPHFLFNALTTLGYLIKTDADKAFDTLLKLTQLLRGVLKKTSEFTPLRDEIALVENYLEIERVRFEEKLEVNIEIDPEAASVEVPTLILQPIVENAIKHAISENRTGGRIFISAVPDAEGRDLVLTVADTGAGSGVKRNGGEGVGLRNVRDRLQNHYGSAASLAMVGRDGGTVVTITLPTGVNVYE